MALMYLVDTNIFLEILLAQDRNVDCKEFLKTHSAKIALSDFTLHSIGVILFKQKQSHSFQQFIKDMLPKITLLSLPKAHYNQVIEAKNAFNLDFDDAYQYAVCHAFNLSLLTMDKDFQRIDDLNVVFL